MEVAGHSHYENVCSNILRFYFDPQEDHGLEDLLVRSLFSLCGGPADESIERINIYREHQTINGGRLDLVLEGEGFVVGIENKIYHWIANDLDDYGHTIDSIGDAEFFRFKLVLGLKPVTENLPGGFQAITYTQLWDEVENRLGGYVAKADSKWLQYFLDFIQTTRKLTGNPMEESLPNDQFFIENDEVIERLIDERSKFLNRLRNKLNQLHGMVSEEEDLKKCLRKEPWIYNKSCLVLDFLLTEKQHSVALDLYLSPKGWELQLFGRNKEAATFLSELIANSPALQKFRECELIHGRHIAQRWDLQVGLADIHDYLVPLAKQLHEVGHLGSEPLA